MAETVNQSEDTEKTAREQARQEPPDTTPKQPATEDMTREAGSHGYVKAQPRQQSREEQKDAPKMHEAKKHADPETPDSAQKRQPVEHPKMQAREAAKLPDQPEAKAKSPIGFIDMARKAVSGAAKEIPSLAKTVVSQAASNAMDVVSAATPVGALKKAASLFTPSEAKKPAQPPVAQPAGPRAAAKAEGPGAIASGARDLVSGAVKELPGLAKAAAVGYANAALDVASWATPIGAVRGVADLLQPSYKKETARPPESQPKPKTPGQPTPQAKPQELPQATAPQAKTQTPGQPTPQAKPQELPQATAPQAKPKETPQPVGTRGDAKAAPQAAPQAKGAAGAPTPVVPQTRAGAKMADSAATTPQAVPEATTKAVTPMVRGAEKKSDKSGADKPAEPTIAATPAPTPPGTAKPDTLKSAGTVGSMKEEESVLKDYPRGNLKGTAELIMNGVPVGEMTLDLRRS